MLVTSSILQSDSVLRLPEVERRTGLKRATIYRHIAAGTFPHSVSLGSHGVGWVETDVQGWIQNHNKDAAKSQQETLGVQPADRPLASRIRRSHGRTPRSYNANARLTQQEHAALKNVAAAQGKAFGEWAREVLLGELGRHDGERAVFTELMALRLLMNGVLRELALGRTMTPEQHQALVTEVRKTKHEVATNVLKQYQPAAAEEE